MPMLAGVGLMMVCCSSSSAIMMMGGEEEDPDPDLGSGPGPGPGSGDSCVETLSGEKDEGYRGCQTNTRSGKTCQNWNIQTPHGHQVEVGKKGVGDHNYCRNPGGDDTIWCYTTDPDKRWEYCDPVGGRVCDETMSGEKGVDYRGCQTKTTSGKTCQNWSMQSPHGHSQKLGERGIRNHNYCRNPDGEDKIWCYTTDPDKRWEYCDPL